MKETATHKMYISVMAGKGGGPHSKVRVRPTYCFLSYSLFIRGWRLVSVLKVVFEFLHSRYGLSCSA